LIGKTFETISGSEAMTVAGQLVRYASVGVCTNIASYLFYLWLTVLGSPPIAAATSAFAGAVILSFALNRSVTFRSAADPRRLLRRYVVAYGIAYGIDVGGLYVVSTLLRYPHELVQLALIVIIAFGLFAAQKWWVFAAGVDHEFDTTREPVRAITDRATL
jgi:putative flippase GtrA